MRRNHAGQQFEELIKRQCLAARKNKAASDSVPSALPNKALEYYLSQPEEQ